MDAVFLSRIQFALTAGFHFIFPPLTFGLGLIILIYETLYIRTDKEIYKNISKFIVKIFSASFINSAFLPNTIRAMVEKNCWALFNRLGARLSVCGIATRAFWKAGLVIPQATNSCTFFRASPN